MKIIEQRIQTTYVIIVNQLLLAWCLFNIFQWWMLPLIILNLYLFGIFWEVAIHRYWSHQSFKTSRPKEIVLLLWAFLTGQGSILGWCNVHRHHHKYEDTKKDPHSPFYENWFRIYLGYFKNRCDEIFVRDLLRHNDRKYLTFENKYYYLMWSAMWIITYIISPLLFFWLVSGSATWWIATTAINIVAHGKLLGKQQFSDSVATNSSILNVLTGMGNHNNHHKYPASYTCSTGKEIDIHGWVIKYCFKK